MGGFTSFLLLLCVGFTLSAVLDLQKRITGGHDCARNEALYHVRLTPHDGTRIFLCGGSLISKSWILTAAHCWKPGETMTVEVGVHPNGGQPEPVTRHEIIRGHDIMLLKLKKPTQINHFVRLPKCGRGGKPPLGPKFQIAGYGPTHLHGKTHPNNLQCADVSLAYCDWRRWHIQHPDPGRYMFCGSAPGVTNCGGDSGGGAVFNGVIYGVIKGNTNDTCNPISVFMNVCEYMGDIRRITGIH